MTRISMKIFTVRKILHFDTELTCPYLYRTQARLRHHTDQCFYQSADSGYGYSLVRRRPVLFVSIYVEIRVSIDEA